MSKLVSLTENELNNYYGGGAISAAAGALAGGMIGTFASLPYAAATGDASSIGKAAITGACIGGYVGAGCPLP